MEFDIPLSQKDPSLPMIINLRGDEDLVEEFIWDAEQAMEFLGIKRSRLTQISGKELRVGRIRRDRYLRPVYRESDLKDYQEWTRATATHQSSSRAIEQAIDSLDDRFSDLFVVIQEKFEQFESRSAQLLRQQLQRLDHSQGQRSKLGEALHDQDQQLLTQRLMSELHKVQGLQQEQKQRTQTLQTEVTELRGLFGLFHQDLRSLLVQQNQLRKDLASLQEAQIEQQVAAEKLRMEQWQAMQAEIQLLQKTCLSLLEKEREVEATVEVPSLRPSLLRHRKKSVTLRPRSGAEAGPRLSQDEV